MILTFSLAASGTDLRVLIEVTQPRRLCRKKEQILLCLAINISLSFDGPSEVYVYLYWTTRKSNGVTRIWIGEKMLRAIYGDRFRLGRFMIAKTAEERREEEPSVSIYLEWNHLIFVINFPPEISATMFFNEVFNVENFERPEATN